jgi:energy-coupling factor transport system substrate-specific component
MNTAHKLPELLSRLALVVTSLLALGVVAWPLLASAGNFSSQSAVVVSLVVMPALIVVLSLVLDSSLRNTTVLALVGVLAALAAAARVVSTGAGGFELVFVVVILAGRALGARLGFVVGILAIALSSLVWGGFGPWSAFQMLAVGWVGAGAGLLPHRGLVVPPARRWREVAMLAGYGVIASYAFGLVMNLWFWPIALGPDTTLSLVDGGGLADNTVRWLVYSLGSSTLTWDTVRALTTAVTLSLVGRPVLVALRRVYDRSATPKSI